MNYDTKINFNKFVYTWLSDQFSDGAENSLMKKFSQWGHTTENKTFTVQEYAQEMLSVITHLLRLDEETSYRVSMALDSILIMALPNDLSKKLAENTIRFAQTNWNDKDENIYFCVYFNPRTKEVDFARINEDGSGLDPMDEYEWINKQTWEAIPVDFAEVVNK